jgi:hypothetical protein
VQTFLSLNGPTSSPFVVRVLIVSQEVGRLEINRCWVEAVLEVGSMMALLQTISSDERRSQMQRFDTWRYSSSQSFERLSAHRFGFLQSVFLFQSVQLREKGARSMIQRQESREAHELEAGAAAIKGRGGSCRAASPPLCIVHSDAPDDAVAAFVL